MYAIIIPTDKYFSEGWKPPTSIKSLSPYICYNHGTTSPSDHSLNVQGLAGGRSRFGGRFGRWLGHGGWGWGGHGENHGETHENYQHVLQWMIDCDNEW